MQQRAKARTRKTRRQHHSNTAIELKAQPPRHLQRAMELGSENGASSWISALPMEDLGFDLHKGAFRDALCMRYNWQPTHLHSKFICGKAFSTDHALSCPTGKRGRSSGNIRVREFELGSFTLLIFSNSGGMSRSTAVAYKRLASLLANQPYSVVMAWLRCHLSFSLLRSAIICLRGARSTTGHATHHSRFYTADSNPDRNPDWNPLRVYTYPHLSGLRVNGFDY